MNEFKKNELTRLYEKTTKVGSFNLRFVQKKSKQLGMVVQFFNGKDAETYNVDGQIMENSHGMAHFLEHLLFTNVTDDINWLKKLVSENVTMNGATGENVVFYHIVGKTESMLKTRIEQLMKIAFTLDINEELFEKEKGIVSTEASLTLDDKKTMQNAILSKYYNLSHQSHSVVGTPETVNSIKMDEVVNYYQSVYSLDNCEIQIFADFEANENLESEVSNKILDVYENVIKNYKIHSLEHGKKREVENSRNVVLDQKDYEITSPKINKKTVKRILIVNSKDENGFKLDGLAAGSLLQFTSTLVNSKVKDLITKHLDINSSNFPLIPNFDSKHHYSIEFESDTIENLEVLYGLFKKVVNNLDEYIDEKKIDQLVKTDIINELSQVDFSLAQIYTMYAMRSLNPSAKLGFDNHTKLDIKSFSNKKMYKEVVQNIDFENYIDVYFDNTKTK